MNKMILSNAAEIDEIIKANKIHENATILLNDLEKINVYTPKPEKADLLGDKGFNDNIKILFDAHINEKKEDDNNEKLLFNELTLMKKIYEKSNNEGSLKVNIHF